jgi:hypothetical protein
MTISEAIVYGSALVTYMVCLAVIASWHLKSRGKQ